MKYFVMAVLFGAVLYSYFNSSITWYSHDFAGESEHWTGSLVTVSNVRETDKEKEPNQHWIKYMTTNKLKLSFKGSLNELGEYLKFSYEHIDLGGSSSERTSNGSTFQKKVFTSSGGSGGALYYPKDMTFLPVTLDENESIPVKIEWNGQSETLVLTME